MQKDLNVKYRSERENFSYKGSQGFACNIALYHRGGEANSKPISLSEILIDRSVGQSYPLVGPS